MFGENEIIRSLGEGFATTVFEDIMDNKRGYAHGPERALLSALLFDGIQSYISFALAENTTQRAQFSEAYRWMMNRGNDYAFSFEATCEALGVNPEYLRLGLVNATTSLLTSISKARRIG